MATINALRLPIDWKSFGWAEHSQIGEIAIVTGDPAWGWEPAALTCPCPTMGSNPGTSQEGFTVDHVVLLVPDLEGAVDKLSQVGLEPRLRMPVRGRLAAFFRAGPVLEVIESPVRQASIYGVAVATTKSLESLALAWRALGIAVGDIKPAIQPGRRIMTVHDLDAGFAVMSVDGAVT